MLQRGSGSEEHSLLESRGILRRGSLGQSQLGRCYDLVESEELVSSTGRGLSAC